MTHLDDPMLIIRLSCIFISCTINSILFITTFYRLFVNNEKTLNSCLLLLILYLLFAFITPAYNIVYRFIITPEQCFISDTIEECLVVFTRIIILFFYLCRLKTVFKATKYEINNILFIILSLFIISYSIIIPLIWIPKQIVTPYITNELGVYCSNTGNMVIIALYYVCDFIFTLILTIIFVIKLCSVKSKSRNRHLSIQQIEENKLLTTLVTKSLILTTLSIISSWIIMYPSYLSSSEIRWFYPLDYGLNGLCLFFMFSWNNCCNGCNKNEQEYIDDNDDSNTKDNIIINGEVDI